MNEFKKYNDSRRKTNSFLNSAHRKSVSKMKQLSRQKEAERKKRMKAYSKELEKDKAMKGEQRQIATRLSEQESQEEGCLFLLILVVLVVLYFTIGVKWLLILGGIVAFIWYVVVNGYKEKNCIRQLSQDEINMLQYHLSCIDINQDVANNSNDVQAVKKALDGLVKSIDYIMQYEESELRQAGATKGNLSSQREVILKHYDVIIKQAEERNRT